MSDQQIYRDSLSAWRGLSSIGGLEPKGRDADLAAQLKQRIDPDAESLEDALTSIPVADFLSALLATIQPFATMFRDILEFFEKAGARLGQSQWRLDVGGELAELRHFEEFVEAWSTISFDIDVPALDGANAFLISHVFQQFRPDYLSRGKSRDGGSVAIGIPDVDAWLAAYQAGQYLPLPQSLAPEAQPPGLDDAARVVMAALHVIGKRGLSKEEMKSEHVARSYRNDPTDAFHPWTIAQSETDNWLQIHVQYLANLLDEPNDKRVAFGVELAKKYAEFGRRRFSTTADVRSLERILSLPAWKRRYEFYGVWVATQIIEALDDHEVRILHDQGALRFAFVETRLADIESSRPLLSVYSERRSPLSGSIGKSRTTGAQPDYGIWTRDPSARCVLVIEVKHYKKESTTNFGAALIDYAYAHPAAKILLVNYGPAKADYGHLYGADKNRCCVLGYFNPDMLPVRSRFRELVRGAVGDPVRYKSPAAALTTTGIVAVDVSRSMSSILESDWFWSLVGMPENANLDLYLVDKELRGRVKCTKLRDWITKEALGQATSLRAPVAQLLQEHETVILLTDNEGAASLADLHSVPIELLELLPEAQLLRLTR